MTDVQTCSDIYASQPQAITRTILSGQPRTRLRSSSVRPYGLEKSEIFGCKAGKG